MTKSYILQNFHVSKKLTFIFIIFFCSTISLTAKSKIIQIDEINTLIPDSTLTNDKVVYVDFWASWCIPCRKSFPWMNDMLTRYSDSGLVFITINVDKDLNAAEKFLTQNKINSIKLFDSEGKIAKLFALKVMPTSFVYDRLGTFIFKHEGFSNEESLDVEKKILTLLHGGKTTHE